MPVEPSLQNAKAHVQAMRYLHVLYRMAGTCPSFFIIAFATPLANKLVAILVLLAIM